MECQRIKNSLDNIPDKVPIFITKKSIEVHDQSREAHNTNKQIRFKTSMLRSDLCDFSDPYIVVKGIVTVSADEIDRDVMPMYNLLEYSKNYSKTSVSLWNYYRDQLTGETNDNSPSKNVINSKSFKYKTSITGSTYNVPRRITGADGNPVNNPDYDRNKRSTKKVEIAVPLKHLGNFLNSLNIPLINCEVSLAFS